jgi:hypothetical protein
VAVIDSHAAPSLRPVSGDQQSRAAIGWADGFPGRLPVLVALGVLVGLAIVVLGNPLGSGDYGQWLMTSRFYLGESVPDYRVIGDVPFVVPALLAGVQLFVPDPVAALHLAAALLLIGLGTAFYLCGTLALASRWAGVAAVALGLLVTDRFTELFAFGGLLQATAVALLILSVAAFVEAGRTLPGRRSAWWFVAVGSLGLSALSHVGTGLVAVPVGTASALIAFNPLRREALRDLRRVWLPAIALAAVGGYWLLVLFSAGGEYVSNPASLGYRGPDRLIELLFEQWPTALIIVIGGASIALGALRAVVLRRRDGWLWLAAWAAVSWAIFAALVVRGSATDYPRFATVLLAPLVLGAAGGLMWALEAFDRYLRDLRLRPPRGAIIGVGVVVVILVTAPMAVDRQGRQADFYQLRAPESLVVAAAWLDEALGDRSASVLADAREAKWLEGLTGRASLFSQPVRYAFRPVEWDRSVAADSLLRSVETLTSGLVTARFTTLAGNDAHGAPSDLLISANHRGEMVDLLRLPPSATQIRGDGGATSLASLRPMGSSSTITTEQASLRTVWGTRGEPVYSQRVTAWQDGSALSVIQQAAGQRLTSRLLPASGTAITSLQVDGADAVACFTMVGDSAPCIRIHVTQPDAKITGTADGAIRISTSRSDRLDLLVTALTAGDASVGLGLLDPAQLVEQYHVGAALLYAPDPAYRERAARLAAIGFREVQAFGPYRVLMRSGGAAQ